jgi:hypothetical protein
MVTVTSGLLSFTITIRLNIMYGSKVKKTVLPAIYRVGHKSLDTSNLPLHIFVKRLMVQPVYITNCTLRTVMPNKRAY